MAESFADALNQLISGGAISGNKLAERLEVDPSQVSRWRTGEGVPRPENISRLAEQFNVDRNWLLSLAYPSREAAPTGPDDEDLAISATMAEMREILRGLPRVYWGTVIKAFSRGVDGARDMAQLLTEGRTADAPHKTTGVPDHRTTKGRVTGRSHGVEKEITGPQFGFGMLVGAR